jgi:hypothetical protein
MCGTPQVSQAICVSIFSVSAQVVVKKEKTIRVKKR